MAVRLVECLAWAAVCSGVWLATLSTISWQELAVGGAAAVVCGAAAAGGRSLVGGRWTVRPQWLRWVWRLLLSVPIETAQALWAAAGRRAGRQDVVDLPAGEPNYVSASRRAIGTVLISASPGSYVIDADPDERRLHLHRLGPGAPVAFQVDVDRK